MKATDLSILGLYLAGDVAGVTCYTDRHGRLVVYPKEVKVSPPSPRQSFQRLRFTLAQRSWNDLTSVEKENLEEVARRNSLPMTGQNLWISATLTGKSDLLATAARKAGISVPLPTPLSSQGS